ncbi:hypothetical protein PSPO01_02699 [Paraphaeosphaeria sporulosa]
MTPPPSSPPLLRDRSGARSGALEAMPAGSLEPSSPGALGGPPWLISLRMRLFSPQQSDKHCTLVDASKSQQYDARLSTLVSTAACVSTRLTTTGSIPAPARPALSLHSYQ